MKTCVQQNVAKERDRLIKSTLRNLTSETRRMLTSYDEDELREFLRADNNDAWTLVDLELITEDGIITSFGDSIVDLLTD